MWYKIFCDLSYYLAPASFNYYLTFSILSTFNTPVTHGRPTTNSAAESVDHHGNIQVQVPEQAEGILAVDSGL